MGTQSKSIMSLQRRKRKTLQHNTKKKKKKKVKKTVSSPPTECTLSSLSLSALSYHQSLLLLFLLLLAGSVHCALRARAIPTKICATLPDMNLSLCVLTLSLSSFFQWRAWVVYQGKPTPATELPNSTDLHHLWRSSSATTPVGFARQGRRSPPSDSTACLPACNGQPSPVQHEERKKGRKEGWMDG